MRTTVHPASADDVRAVAGIAADGPPVASGPDGPFATQRVTVGGVDAEWVAAPGTSGAGVVVYLHGGQFPESAVAVAQRLSSATERAVLLVRADLPAVWQGLIEQGLPARRVVLAGHASGATSVLALVRSLVGAGRPLPAGVVAISPTTDDPASGLPPLFIAYGGDEVLAADARRFAERADAAGVDVTLDVFDGLPHDFPVLLPRPATTLFARIAAFVAGGADVRPTGPLTIRRIGWAGVEIVSETGTRVVVDPYQSGAEGFHSGLPESPVAPDELFGADVVAVTHAGFDHRGQALEIVKGGAAILASGPALFGAALAAGLPTERLAPMVSGVELCVRDVTVKALPARHDSTMSVGGGSVSDQPLSFLIRTAAGRRILCAGDCSLSQDYLTWRELYRPEIAVLPIGGVWIGPVNVANLPPGDAAAAADWLGVSTVLPVHHRPGDAEPARLAADLAARGEAIEVVNLGFGETWTAPEPDEYDN
ncbi:MAG TPA: MBL fold metallo-hydrolase [Pseudonocardiaceae bacterium]|jgi:L-ascorbate metabolism protein UlaG (beta-lactamase superfamily)